MSGNQLTLSHLEQDLNPIHWMTQLLRIRQPQDSIISVAFSLSKLFVSPSTHWPIYEHARFPLFRERDTPWMHCDCAPPPA